MKKVCWVLLMGGLVAGLGCNRTTGPSAHGSRAGGGGAALGSDNYGAAGRGEAPSGAKPSSKETFSLKGSWTSETIKQGQSKDLKVSVSKGKEFKQDIRLTFEPEKGLTVEPKTVDVKPSDPSGDVAVRVSAANDAAIGTLHIKVLSEPPTAEPLDLTVKVEKP
jgi:hypothetical protein